MGVNRTHYVTASVQIQNRSILRGERAGHPGGGNVFDVKGILLDVAINGKVAAQPLEAHPDLCYIQLAGCGPFSLEGDGRCYLVSAHRGFSDGMISASRAAFEMAPWARLRPCVHVSGTGVCCRGFFSRRFSPKVEVGLEAVYNYATLTHN